MTTLLPLIEKIISDDHTIYHLKGLVNPEFIDLNFIVTLTGHDDPAYYFTLENNFVLETSRIAIYTSPTYRHRPEGDGHCNAPGSEVLSRIFWTEYGKDGIYRAIKRK